jgi:hypothetical protein
LAVAADWPPPQQVSVSAILLFARAHPPDAVLLLKKYRTTPFGEQSKRGFFITFAPFLRNIHIQTNV